jgi:predicted ATPase/DNA-binding winged helix-turn-helix (wHTH) protein
MSQPSPTSGDHGLAFGPFRLLPEQHMLFEAGKPVRLGSRALDILIVLVERAGDVVSKEELIARVWPDTFVEDGNLRVHIAGLRKALGDGRGGNRFLATDPGRGYRFVASVTAVAPEPILAAGSAATSDDVPAALVPARIVGRSEVVAALATQLPLRRFITIVGPGGIGKTTVAAAVADRRADAYRDGVWFVDLAPLVDPALVVAKLASQFGLPVSAGNVTADLVAFLRHKQMLLVLDTCEHVVDRAADLAEAIFHGAQGIHILATSREPLRANGERITRLPPLDIPPSAGGLTAAEALRFSAVQLFVERAEAALDSFVLTDADAPVVSAICRRLDGIALAIELAASAVETFGVARLFDLLEDRFRLLMRGRRTALARHQTLAAVLDWSYETLSAPEQVALCRMSILAGAFDLDAAVAVAEGGRVAAVVDCIADLVAKSLVSVEVGEGFVRYRLLDTTRAYALGKLRETGEYGDAAQRHARHCIALFGYAGTHWDSRPEAAWLADFRRHLDNARVALDWAFSSDGDLAVGIALTIGAVLPWTRLSLVDESRMRIDRAIDAGEAAATPLQRMQLFYARGAAILNTGGTVEAMDAAWTITQQIAETLHDPDYELRALWGLWVNRINVGAYRAALLLAERFAAVTERGSETTSRPLGDRMLGASFHLLGDQTSGRLHTERMLSKYIAPPNAVDILRFQFDQKAMARNTLSKILWLQGYPDQAMSSVEANVSDARSAGHEITLTYVLCQSACLVALYAGDLSAAERYLAMLAEQPSDHMLGPWGPWGRCFAAILLLQQGHTQDGLDALRAALHVLPVNVFQLRHTPFLGEVAQAEGRLGNAAGGLATVEGAIATAKANEEGWCLPELLRVRGELLANDGGEAGTIAAERELRSAVDMAHRQGALSWELRAATSLARLHRERRRDAEAREMLEATLQRFTEGFRTADLVAAAALLGELGGAIAPG